VAKIWFSVKELADRFGKSADSIERMLRTKELPGKKVGGTWRVHADDLYAYENEGRERAGLRPQVQAEPAPDPFKSQSRSRMCRVTTSRRSCSMWST
jgi:excisionase family DNA binding protein